MFKETKKHTFPRRSAGESLFTRGPVLIICALMAIHAPVALAEVEDECLFIQEELSGALPNKCSNKGCQAAQREYLISLLNEATSSCAFTLAERLLGDNQSYLTWFRHFHNNFDEATREELIDVLAHRFNYAHVDEDEDTNNETDIQCMQVQDDLTALLNRKYTRSDKKGLYKRRQQMNRLAENTTPSCAQILTRTLGRSRNDSDSTISALFHGKLAAATRNEILDILEFNQIWGIVEDRSNSLATVIEGEIELGITPDQVRAAATRAKRILASTPATNDIRRSLEKLECIVEGIEANPKHFNDSYYPVAPPGVNVLHTDNPWTCYKKPHPFTRQPSCRQDDSVIEHCEKSFNQAIVNASIAGESDQEILELMLRQEDHIDRGLAYFRSMRNIAGNLGGSENRNAMMCKSAAEHLLPRMSSSSSQDRIYNCYPDP